MTHKTLDTWNQLAEKYAARFMDFDMYNDSYDVLIKQLEGRERVLELGCGPGNVAKYFLQRLPSLDYYATDGAPEMIVLAQKLVPSVHGYLLEAEQLDAWSQPYEICIAAFIWPYLTQETTSTLLQIIDKQIRGKGLLYLSFIESENYQTIQQTSSDGKHAMEVHLHDTSYQITCLNNMGWEIIYNHGYGFERAEGNETHRVLIAQKKHTDRDQFPF